jgi:hypothetical protein
VAVLVELIETLVGQVVLEAVVPVQLEFLTALLRAAQGWLDKVLQEDQEDSQITRMAVVVEELHKLVGVQVRHSLHITALVVMAF